VGLLPQGIQKFEPHVIPHQLFAKMLISMRALYYLASRLINVGSINSINCTNLKLVIDLLGVEFCTKRASGFEVIAASVSLAESTQPHVILY